MKLHSLKNKFGNLYKEILYKWICVEI